MKILCNLPLESFEDRDQYGDVEIVTYGPASRMRVDDRFYPYDVEFDPGQESIHELLRRMPQGFTPDIVLIYWPDQEPIPARLEECPVRVVGVLSDYNLTLPFVTGLWPFFDTLLVDRAGVELFERLSFADTRYFCQFTFKARSHRIYPEVEKDLDVAFAGNLNPIVQAERMPFLERICRLGESGLRVELRDDVWGESYGRFINRARIGFNRSIRGEMNLRAFEVPACGATLLMESSNREVREFLVPGEEFVLYDDDNLESIVRELVANPKRCAEIAAAGHRRVQDYRMGKRLNAMAELLAQHGPRRFASNELDLVLGRSAAMLATWARQDVPVDELMRACESAPDDPRPMNLLAVALLMRDSDEHGQTAIRLLHRACAVSKSYAPAAFNIAYLTAASDGADLAPIRDEAMRRLSGSPRWRDLDGLVLPFGFSEEAITRSRSLADAIRGGDSAIYAQSLIRQLQPELSHTT